MTRRLPTHRAPTHPGEMLRDFMEDLETTQTALADALQISRVRVNEILNGKRGVTPDTALRLERVLGKAASWWLRLQQDYDLWQAMHGSEMKEIEKLHRLTA